MKTKLKTQKREFINNDNKTIICHLTHSLNINDLLNNYMDSTDLYNILIHDMRWIKFRMDEKFIRFNGPIIEISTTGKAICHDDDGFNEKYGQHLAEDRALEKALYTEDRIIKKIMNIFKMYLNALDEIQYNNSQIINGISRKIFERENDYEKY